MQRRRIGSDGVERMARIPALAALSTGQRRELARLVDELTASDGEVLMSQGEPGLEFMMLEEGSADVVKDGARINVMGPGDFFGELAILGDGAPRTASVVASSDVRAIILTAHFMREMRARMPAVGAEIDRVAGERIERDAQAGR